MEEQTIAYDPLNYWVVSVAVPAAAQIIEASHETPCLSMMLEFESLLLNQIILEMACEDSRWGETEAQRAVYSSSLSEPILNSVNRLLAVIDSPMDSRVLGPGAVREILYRALMGPQGACLRASAQRDSGTYRVAQAVQYFENNLAASLNIAAISKKLGMSESTLHQTFKSVTAMSPMQYLKKLRLYRARHLMVAECVSVDEVRSRVGYNSASQFSCEF